MKEHPTEKEEISAYHIPGKGWISKYTNSTYTTKPNQNMSKRTKQILLQ